MELPSYRSFVRRIVIRYIFAAVVICDTVAIALLLESTCENDDNAARVLFLLGKICVSTTSLSEVTHVLMPASCRVSWLAFRSSTKFSSSWTARTSSLLFDVEVESNVSLIEPTSVEWHVNEGHSFQPITHCATVRGSVRKILLGERVALNILARCSGVATKSVFAGPRILNTPIPR